MLKTQQWPQDGKRSVFIPITKKGNSKECSNYYTISLILNNSKGSKFSKRAFNSTWTESFQMFKLDLETAEKQEIQLPTSLGSYKKQESSGKTTTSAVLTTPQVLIMWLTRNCGKFLKRWEHQTTLPASWEICMHVKKRQWELDMWQCTDSKLGKEYVKAVYCQPAYLTYMYSTSCDIPGWMNHKLESRFQWEISIISDMQMTPPLQQKVKRHWGVSWWNWKKKVQKLASNATFKNRRSWHQSHPFMQTVEETMETATDFIFLGSNITADGDYSRESKRCLLLGRKAMTNLGSILRSRNITLLKKVHVVKAMVFLIVMYGYESWTMTKAECRRTDAFELSYWRRLMRVPWTARRSHHSILKEISPGYSLEWHGEAEAPILRPPDAKNWLTQKYLMLGKTEDERRRGEYRMI